MTFRAQSIQANGLKHALSVVLLASAVTLASAPVFAQQLPDVASLFEAQKSSVVAIQIEASTPANPFFRMPNQGQRVGQGSGFVVDPDGYIVTNNHVIDGAQKIIVHFENGESYEAKLVGTDPSIDIAMVKIDAKTKMPAAQLGSSEALKVGQWVVAIGNPYGLEYSVTAGIISAKGRNIGAGPYDNFLQTDASINPGNSGGPLFDMSGKVVGVNTAIIRDGQGIGFAVPIDVVKAAIPQLKTNGYISRGYMGAGIQPLTAELAKSFGVAKNKGALIGSIEDGGPAAKAGLRPGDVVTKFNGRDVTDVQSLLLAVAETPPGTKAPVDVIRSGKAKRLNIAVVERPDARRADVQPASTPAKQLTKLGVEVKAIDRALGQRLGAEPGVGVVVTNVQPNSIGAQIVRPGDIILEVNGRAVNTPKALQSAVSRPSGEVVRSARAARPTHHFCRV
ncbi:MAG: trypsin-like peptidase domain-containing protein [bacterium]